MNAAEVMRLVSDYAAGMGVRSLDEQAAAYLAVGQAVEALAAAVKPEPRRAVAWAVLDAEDTVRATLAGRKQTVALAHALDWKAGGGHRVAPLVLADLDDVDIDPADAEDET